MTQGEFEVLPEAQRKALRDLQERSGYSWGDFLSKCAAPNPRDSYVGVYGFHGMFVGVEPDGYTHS